MRRYAVAVLALAVALALELAFPPLFSTARLFVFVTAVIASAIYGGAGPALLALVASTVAAAMLVMPPLGSVRVASRVDLVQLVLFDVVCAAMIAMIASHRRSERETQRLRDDRMRHLETISRERERLQSIISNIPGVVWEAWGQPNTATQQIDFVSAHVERMLGYSVDEWLASPNFWLGIVHPDDRERAAANAAEHFAAGGSRVNEFRWVTKDGHVLSVQSQSTVMTAADGTPVGMRGVTLDVTAQKRAEEAIRLLAAAGEMLANSLEYDTTLRAIAAVALPLLGDMCLVDVLNTETGKYERTVAHRDADKQPLADALARIFAPEADGETLTMRVVREGRPRFGNSLPDELLARFTRTSEHARLVRELGIESYVVVPMQARGRVIGALALTCSQPNRYDEADLDLASQLGHLAALAVENARLHRDAVDASRARDQFLATVSHELRTPMTATLGWVRMLLLGSLDEPTTRLALESIDRSTRAQARLIEDILDVASVITGKFRISVSTVDLARAVRNAIDTLQPAADAKGIALGVDVSGWSGTLPGDEARLQQVVWNLVQNAIKFGHRGGRIEVSLRRDGDSAKLVVRDDGPGIDAAFLPFIFDRFRQAEGGSTRAYGGLGLGLAVVRHLVELHGGSVSAASDGHGRGATFTVELPMGAVRDAARDPQPLPRLDRRRILVVDDESDARTTIAAVLRQCGAVVTTAASADEAMLLLNAQRAAGDRSQELVIDDVAVPQLATTMGRLRIRHHDRAVALDPVDVANRVAAFFAAR